MGDFSYTAELYIVIVVMAIFLTAVPTYFSYGQQFLEHLFFLNQIKIDKTRRPVSENKKS